MALSDSIINSFTKELENYGEAVTIYNSTQTLDTETDYGSLTADTYVDGTDEGTSEVAVIQPMNIKRPQLSEGRLLIGEMIGFFKSISVITENSLVKVDATDRLYKVKELQRLRVSGFLTHYEVILEFVRVVS